MANINSYLVTISRGVYGRDVRDAIHDAIQAVNNDLPNSSSVVAEVQEARMNASGATYAKLKGRLDSDYNLLYNKIEEDAQDGHTAQIAINNAITGYSSLKNRLDSQFEELSNRLLRVKGDADRAEAAATTADSDLSEIQTLANMVQVNATNSTRDAGLANQAMTAAQGYATGAYNDRVAAQTAKDAAVTANSNAEAYAVGTRGGVDVGSSDVAYHNNAKYYAEQGGAGNLASEFSTSTAYAVGDYVRYNAKIWEFTTAHAAGAWNASHVAEVIAMDEVSDLKSDLNDIKFVFASTAETPETTASAYRLNENDGLCTSNPSYKLVKYAVTAGNWVKVVSDDRFQFQNQISVPASGANNRVGKTYQNGTFIVEVPQTATYLIVSTPTTSNASVYIQDATINELVGEVVRFTAQSLTDAQKAQARENIGVTETDEETIREEEINLEDYVLRTGWLNGDNTWSTTNTANYKIIPVEAGQILSLLSSTGVFISLLQSYVTPIVNGSAASIVSGWGRKYITQDTGEIINVPDGANYLYIGLSTSQATQTVDSLKRYVINKRALMYEFLKNSINVSVESSTTIDVTQYTPRIGFLDSNNKWVTTNGAQHCIIPIDTGDKITVEAKSTNATYVALFASYTTPVAGNTANVVNGWGRKTLNTNETLTITVPENSTYLYVTLAYNGNSLLPKSVEKLSSDTISVNTLSDAIDDAIDDAIESSDDVIRTITFDTPITIFTNKDEDSTELDNVDLASFKILQVSDSMYYLYYSAFGGSKSIRTDEYQADTLFAYSTDGIHYTRGFPSGITAPFPGTNKILTDDYQTNKAFNDVFKCSDPVHPFRLICEEKVGTDEPIVMYKSSDGVNFDLSTRKVLRYDKHDCQNIGICKGNIIKCYFREREYKTIDGVSHFNRRLGVCYYDLDGVMLSPSKILPIEFIYDSGASAISDVEELIFPTYYDDALGDKSFRIDAYRVDKYSIKQVQTNINECLSSDDKFVLVSPGIININGEQYISYLTQDCLHGESTSNTLISYKLVKMTMSF